MQLLNDLNYPFHIISLLETWLNRSNEQISNLDLLGYSFLSQPTAQRAGRVGMYINNGIQYSVRHYLTLCHQVLTRLVAHLVFQPPFLRL